MKVLITGATGFLGQRLVRRMKTYGYDIYAVGRNSKIGDNLRNLGAHFLNTDLSRLEDYKTWPSNLDAVVHCAALSSPWGQYKDFFSANVTTTQNVLDFVQKASVARLIHISSPSIYVERRSKLDIKESDPLPRRSLSHYISTKRIAEEFVLKSVQRDRVPAIVLRPQGLIGKGDPSIFPRIFKVAQKGYIPRIGKGETWMDLTHVENAVEAVLRSLEAPSLCNGRAYNITNGEQVEIYNFIEKLMRRLNVDFRWRPLSFSTAYKIGHALEWWSAAISGREPLLTRYTACTLGLSRTLNIERARTEIGYRPIYTLDQAFEEVVESYLNVKEEK